VVAVAAAVVLASIAAGCGSDGDDAGNDAASGAAPSVSVSGTAVSSTLLGDSDVATTTAADVSGGEATVPPNGEVVVISSIDNTFRPAELTIRAGTEVVFDNDGRNDHDVTPVPDSPFQDWGVAKADFPPGAAYSYVFGRPGVYEFVCTIHGVPGVGMVGTITVTE
jgi:plastocyanin